MSRAPSAGERPVVLVIEDTPSLQMLYRAVLAGAGQDVEVASTAGEGLAAFARRRPAVVVLDLVLPDRDGLQVMAEMLRQRPETRIVVVTAHGSTDRAVAAMRAGAHDFLLKPVHEERLADAVENALAAVRGRPAPPAPARSDPGQFIGSSPAMQRVLDKIASVAPSMATVFITGESGTGKELCALAVHQLSARASGPFIALNCGAIPQDLLESEVFGHMKGSFTGAISDKPGAAAAADGGTLFLDEVCEMAPALQTKLLRFLQTSTVQPVGATRPRKVNVRIVCATNRDPAEAVRRGAFREDLYYRLYVVPIHMPPLRERDDDVVEIAEAALQLFAAEENRRFEGLAPEVKDLFRRLPWPGNVRQLLNVIRNVVVLNPGGLVTRAMLPEDLAREAVAAGPTRPTSGAAPSEAAGDGISGDPFAGLSLAELERRAVAAALARCGGSIPRAARELDVSPSTLYRKLDAWGQRAV